MAHWERSNELTLGYSDDDNDMSMHLFINTGDRQVCREDIEKIIEYLEECKYDFETME